MPELICLKELTALELLLLFPTSCLSGLLFGVRPWTLLEEEITFFNFIFGLKP